MTENLTYYLLVYFALKMRITCDCHWTGNCTTCKNYTLFFYFFLNDQPSTLIIPILFCYKTLHVSGIFSAHHQEFSTVHSALVSFMQVSDDRFHAESGWNCSSILTLLGSGHEKPAWNFFFFLYALQLLYRVLAFSTNSFHLLISWARVFQFGTFIFCISFLKSSPQRVFGLPVGLLDMGFQE